MATTKTTKKKVEAKASELLIPSLAEVLIPADELEENSYASLEIPSLKISREMQDMASLRQNTGDVVQLPAGKMEIIFFYQSKIVACSAKRISDEDNVCYSTNTDGYSMKGVLCRTECPYKEKEVYKRGFSKKMYFLVRESGTEDPFTLVSYKASYSTMKDVSGNLQSLRRNLHHKGVNTLAFAVFRLHVAAKPASWKPSIKLPVIDFDKVEFIRPLEGDEIAAVQSLHRDFAEFEKTSVQSRLAFAASRATQMQKEVTAAAPPAQQEQSAPMPDPTPTTAAPAKEEPVIDDEDDNLPF